MQGIAAWKRRIHPKQRRKKCRSSWVFILFGKRQHAASRVADKGTGFAVQFEYQRPESSMPHYRRLIKLGFHIRAKRKRHALCVIRQKSKSM